MKSKILIIFLAVTLAVSPVLLSVRETLAQNTLKIGSLSALTGRFSPGEGPLNEGERMAVEWINEKGGITIKGQRYLLELVTEDSKSSGEGMISAATKLVYGQNIKFTVGGIDAEENVAANSVTVPAGVIRLLHWMCLGPKEVGPDTPLTFTNNCLFEGMRPSLTYLKEVAPTAKTLAWLAPEDGGIPTSAKYFNPIAKEYGFEVIYYAGYPLSTVDFIPYVTKALNTKPDVLFLINGWSFMMGSILKAARGLGYKGPCFSVNSTYTGDVIQIAGVKESEGFFSPCWDPLSPKMPPIMAEIAKRHYAKFGKDNPNIFLHSSGFFGPWALVQAIESAQSLDPVVVGKHWQTMKTIETICGTGKMGGLKSIGINNIVCVPQWIQQVRNGKPEIIRCFGADHTP